MDIYDKRNINKLQRFKSPLVSTKSFPSKISQNEEYGALEEVEQYKDEELFSTFSTKLEHKKAPITFWKRADYSDREAVFEFIKKSNFNMNEVFREPDVPDLIEKSSFALIQFNSNQQIISFTSLFCYPNIPSIPSFDWYPWMQTLYRLKDATPRNCFFIHYMVWDNEYYHDFLRPTLETIFLENNFLNHLIIVKPPEVKLQLGHGLLFNHFIFEELAARPSQKYSIFTASIIPENFIQVLPYDAESYDCDYNSLQTLLLCLRYSLMDHFKIRLALVEDHDDLMTILEQCPDRLRKLYGDYCMAEIIEYPGTKDRRTLVCESMGNAVGFMIINRAVDFELLNSQFDLGVFHGLKKPTERDIITKPLPQSLHESPVCLPEKLDPLLEVINSETMLRFLNWQPSLCVSEEDLSVPQTNFSAESNKINFSLYTFIRETFNVKFVPKFTAYALSTTSSVTVVNNSPATLPSTQINYPSESVNYGETEVQSEPSLLSLQHYNLPIYNGPPNAFLIEFFAMHNEFDERLCQHFLEAAFEEFSDLEYCLLTIPSQDPTFPLLDFFTRVTPRPLKRFRQELYVCHKSCVTISFMRVRKITKSDLKEIKKLLKGIKNHKFIYADIASSCYYDDSAYQGFVLVYCETIIGVAVLCNEYGMEYLAHHFHVSDLIDFDLHKIDFHAILKHFVLSPIYQPHARFFLRDIMRMADVTSLYRARYEEAESNWNKSSLITALSQLIPVRPRKMIKYYEESLGSNIPPDYFRYVDVPFSLHHINSRICQINKITSNVNLVIVGSSRTAYSFLESLLFSPSAAYVTYHNITWVSPHGTGTELPSHSARDLMFPHEGKYDRFYKIKICLKTYVHFVYGIMTKINRTDKYITINNDSIIPYDYLIILCGRQFAKPIPLTLAPSPKECRRNNRPDCLLFKYLITQQPREKENTSVYPSNMLLINTDVDATNAFITLQYLCQRKKISQNDGKIIIYGHNLSTYLCAQAIMKFGIQPSIIAIIEPFPSKGHNISCFQDENIDNAVMKSLEELGISHYKGYVLYDWTLCKKNQIQTATFHSDFKKITIKCIAIFPFERKLVSDVTIKAVNEASLVYDGKLVINHNFQTNDPYIYAAGGLTKYQRKYFAKHKNHQYYSSSEIGEYLAEIISHKIDPTKEPLQEKESHLTPNLTKPLILYCVLPGEWNYLSIRKPGKFVHPETKAGIKEFGDVLITGDCEMTKGYGYFKLILDDYGFISDIYCYTKDAIDVENLEILYGKHEKLLNNLLTRFDLGLIKDLYSYFREPWVYAVFHDNFQFLREKNMKLFYETRDEEVKEKFVNVITEALQSNNWQRLSEEKLKEIQEKFEKSDLHKRIMKNTLDFLTYFDEPFPMYATSRILRVLLHDASTSLLHKVVQDIARNFRSRVDIHHNTQKN